MVFRYSLHAEAPVGAQRLKCSGHGRNEDVQLRYLQWQMGQFKFAGYSARELRIHDDVLSSALSNRDAWHPFELIYNISSSDEQTQLEELCATVIDFGSGSSPSGIVKSAHFFTYDDVLSPEEGLSHMLERRYCSSEEAPDLLAQGLYCDVLDAGIVAFRFISNGGSGAYHTARLPPVHKIYPAVMVRSQK
jgi:hypothetical protein